METFETSKHCPVPRHHYHSISAYFTMDAWWNPDGSRQEKPKRRSACSCGCPCCAWSHAHSHRQVCDVASGLYYIHTCNVVHGDLKGVRNYYESCFAAVLTRVQPNILVDATSRARIADFSLTTVTKNLDSIRSATGAHGNTAQWTAPEILKESGTFSKEADIFSFAMVMIEVGCEWVVFAVLCLTAALYYHRDSPAPSRSVIGCLQRLS